MPYPTGVLNRFYLALDPETPEAAQDEPLNQSLSLSLMDEDEDEPSTPQKSIPERDPLPLASGRKRKGAIAQSASASPTKKSASSHKGQDKKGPKETEVAGFDEVTEEIAEPAVEVEMEEEEAEEADSPTSMTMLIDGKWQKVALHQPPADPSAHASGSVSTAAVANSSTPRRHMSVEDPSDGGALGMGGWEEEEEDADMEDEAVENDGKTFMSFLERAMSSPIYLSSLAQLTCSRSFRSSEFDIDVRFFNKIAASLHAGQQAEHIVSATRHYIDAALTLSQPSTNGIEARADEVEDGEGFDADVGAGPSRGSSSAKKRKGEKGGKKGVGGGEGKGGMKIVDVETAKAAVDSVCVLLTTGCSSKLQQTVLQEESTMAALRALDLILRQHRTTSDSTSTTPSRRKSSGGGSAGGHLGACKLSQRAAACHSGLSESLMCTLAALMHLSQMGVLTEEALASARKVAAAALAYPVDAGVRLGGAQLLAVLAAADERARRDTLETLYDIMISTDMSADARGDVPLWAGPDGVLVGASSAALLLLCQLAPPLSRKQLRALRGGMAEAAVGEEGEAVQVAVQGGKKRETKGKQGSSKKSKGKEAASAEPEAEEEQKEEEVIFSNM